MLMAYFNRDGRCRLLINTLVRNKTVSTVLPQGVVDTRSCLLIIGMDMELSTKLVGLFDQSAGELYALALRYWLKYKKSMRVMLEYQSRSWSYILRANLLALLRAINQVLSQQGTGRPVAPLFFQCPRQHQRYPSVALILSKTGKETGGGDAASGTSSDVAHIGKIAIKLILIIIPQRHMPGAIIGFIAGAKQFNCEAILVVKGLWRGVLGRSRRRQSRLQYR